MLKKNHSRKHFFLKSYTVSKPISPVFLLLLACMIGWGAMVIPSSLAAQNNEIKNSNVLDTEPNTEPCPSLENGIQDDKRFLTSDKLYPGMQLHGRTRMSENEMVEFPLRVLSVQRNSRPNADSILAEIEHDLFRETGIISGMSGSPVYFEGRLVGAIAFTSKFQKRPIAGITPIENMLELITFQKQEEKRNKLAMADEHAKNELAAKGASGSNFPNLFQGSSAASRNSFDKAYRQYRKAMQYFYSDDSLVSDWPENTSVLHQDKGWEEKKPNGIGHAFVFSPRLAAQQSPSPGASIKRKIGLLLEASIGELRLPQSMLLQVQGGGLSSFLSQPQPKLLKHQEKKALRPIGPIGEIPIPGDLMAVNLLSGSLNISAYGTVSYVCDKYMLAFGHSMSLNGESQLPLYKAYVDTIVSKLDISYKVGSLREEIGTIQQDRFSAILGSFGVQSKQIPITVSIETKNQRKNFSYFVPADKDYFSPMVSTAFFSSFFYKESVNEELPLQYQLEIGVCEETLSSKTKEAKTKEKTCRLIRNENVFPLNSPIVKNLTAFNGMLQNTLNVLQRNPFAKMSVEHVSLRLRQRQDSNSSDMEILDLRDSKQFYKPGETVALKLLLEEYRGRRRIENITFQLPKDLPEGQYSLHAQSEASFESEQIKAAYSQPKSSLELLQFMNKKRRFNTLLLWMTLPKASAKIRLSSDGGYHALPAGKRRILLRAKLPEVTERPSYQFFKKSYAGTLRGSARLMLRVLRPK